jgi:general secretion pathway protein D
MRQQRICAIATCAAMLAVLYGQQAPPAAAPAAAPTIAPQTTAPVVAGTPAQPGKAPLLNLQNASLTEVIDLLASQLKINYNLDPRVKGSVTVNTYGEMRELDVRGLLDTLLRVNGAAMVQTGDIYRIVPLADIARLPLSPRINPQSVPNDEQMSLNLIFLKYATVGDLSKLLERFLGDGATMLTYEPANLLLILDNNRNMRRTMELIALFDSDVLANQRVRLFEVKNGSPSDIARELETVFRAISLGDKAGAIRFIPLERINTIIAVAPNSGAFGSVETWLQKLDVHVDVTVGAMDNYVYRVKYGQADLLAGVIMQLYMGTVGGGSMGGYTGAASRVGVGGGVGQGGGLNQGMSRGAASMGGRSALSNRSPAAGNLAQGAAGASAAGQQAPGGTATSPFGDSTGYYMGASTGYGNVPEGMPRVVPNITDNSLLIQATAADYERILKLLKELDVPPRQVLIEAKIYEVTLTGAFALGVSSTLQKMGSSDLGSGQPGNLSTRTLQAAANATGLVLTAGTLVGQTRQLLSILTASEDNRTTKVISAPMLIATDSIPASINVGQDVPTLTSQALTGAQAGGNSLFANTISSRNSGVTLSVLARVTDSGIVTLIIDQEVSTAQAPSASSAIQSPSFQTRSVSTQVTVQDGDTIAIGGIIQDTNTSSSAGVPFLHRLPLIGAAFGAKSTSRGRTELVIFMTPRVIYDTNAVSEASDELKSKLKRLSKIVTE